MNSLGWKITKRLLLQDEEMDSSKNTIIFCVVAVTANIVITLFLAKIISVLPSKGMKKHSSVRYFYSVYCADCRNIYGVEIWNGRNRWRIIEPYFGTYGDAA